MRRLLTGLLGVALLLPACGDDDAGGDPAVTSIPDRTTTSSTTTTEPPVPPPDVIPQDVSLITEEYVEQVLNALYEVDLEAVVLAKSEGAVDSPSIELLEATTTSHAAAQRINDLIDMSLGGFDGMSTAPTPLTFDVLQIIDRSQDCLFVEVRVDSSGMFPDAEIPEGSREFARLYPATEDQKGSGLNPTAWVVDQLPVTLDSSLPEAGCS